MKRLSKIILLSLFLWVPLAANAASITVFNALIDGDQADMGQGTGSLGKGAATMTLDTDTGVFEWFVAWQNLVGTITASHFHGPAAPGMNAGVEVGFDHTTNPSIGSATLSAQQMDDLLAGLWYINIHSDVNPGGEIRGQVFAISVIPLPAAAWLMMTALVSLGGLARRR